MKSNRRTFLKQTTTAAGTALVFPALSQTRDAKRMSDFIPPHRALVAAGLHAYSLERSVAAGEVLSLCVSSTVPYDLSIVRLGPEADDPVDDNILQEFPNNDPCPQPIHFGSYLHVTKGLESIGSFSVECWIRHWKVDSFAGIITAFDSPEVCGFGLFVTASGAISFYFGDGKKERAEWLHSSRDKILKKGQWHHVVATRQGTRKELWVDAQKESFWNSSLPEK